MVSTILANLEIGQEWVLTGRIRQSGTWARRKSELVTTLIGAAEHASKSFTKYLERRGLPRIDIRLS